METEKVEREGKFLQEKSLFRLMVICILLCLRNKPEEVLQALHYLGYFFCEKNSETTRRIFWRIDLASTRILFLGQRT